jgi:hypothetical protein
VYILVQEETLDELKHSHDVYFDVKTVLIWNQKINLLIICISLTNMTVPLFYPYFISEIEKQQQSLPQ